MVEQILKWLSTHANAIQALTNIVSIVGIPILAILFFRNMRRDSRLLGDRVYAEVDDLFVSFNKLILEYPHLNIDWNDSALKKLTDNEKVQQDVVFGIVTSMFERVFLTYRNSSNAQRMRQWQGWLVH